MPRMLTTFMALVALVLGLAHGGAMAAAGIAVPAVAAPVVDTASADLPCHGTSADAAVQAPEPTSDQPLPDCCGDGCKGGCAMLAALSGAPMMALPDAVHWQDTRPLVAQLAASRPDGLKRPPRPTA
jgi:hypothetical protein